MPTPRPEPEPHPAGASQPVAGLEAHRMTHLAGAAVRRLRALRLRRDRGELSQDDYRRAVAAELNDDQPPSPGRAG